jgi:Autoinducer binding domain
MSELRTTIVDTVEEIGRANTSDAVWRAIKNYAETQGFQYMLVVKGKHSVIDSVSGCTLYSDMPEGFAQSFDDLGFSKNNPLISHALKEARPYSAAELWAMPLTVQQRRALAQINLSLNVLDGLMIPIRNADVLEGIVLLGGAKPDRALGAALACLLRVRAGHPSGGAPAPRQRRPFVAARSGVLELGRRR